jgi:hypothetical protein
MYGTIARLRVKPGMLDRLRQFGQEEAAALTAVGFVFQHVYQSDQDENEMWLVVGFESREAYVNNAGSPDQHQRYLRIREMLDADPEWHDGEIVDSIRTSD